MMFVRIYTVPAVCVVVQGRAVFTAHVKNKCVMMMMMMMRNTQFACVFQEKNGIHRSLFRKMEWIVGYDSYLL